MAKQPNEKQVAALTNVKVGPVTWGDPYPRRTARTGMAGVPRYMVNGAEVYGHDHVTYESLERNGWIEVRDVPLAGNPGAWGVELTEAGIRMLTAASVCACGDPEDSPEHHTLDGSGSHNYDPKEG